MTALSATAQSSSKRIDSPYYVEGYAAGYDPYLLYDYGDGDVLNERFERGCFDGCDMSDVIMQYDHSGRVYARQSNGSLIVEADDNGLFVAADLSRTEGAKSLYEDISSGMITKMSWAFVSAEWEYERATSTIVHKRIKKIYDVSAVSIPANDNTCINARSGDCLSGALEAAIRESDNAELIRRQRIKIMALTII